MIREFLRKQVKPTLSEGEKVILRNLAIQKFKVIERRENCLCVWKEGTHIPVEILFSHLFVFIKNGEGYKISDLLEE